MSEAPSLDILDRLADLHHQAVENRSHYYTANCISDAIDEIKTLRRWRQAVKVLVGGVE